MRRPTNRPAGRGDGAAAQRRSRAPFALEHSRSAISERQPYEFRLRNLLATRGNKQEVAVSRRQPQVPDPPGHLRSSRLHRPYCNDGVLDDANYVAVISTHGGCDGYANGKDDARAREHSRGAGALGLKIPGPRSHAHLADRTRPPMADALRL